MSLWDAPADPFRAPRVVASVGCLFGRGICRGARNRLVRLDDRCKQCAKTNTQNRALEGDDEICERERGGSTKTFSHYLVL